MAAEPPKCPFSFKIDPFHTESETAEFSIEGHIKLKNKQQMMTFVKPFF